MWLVNCGVLIVNNGTKNKKKGYLNEALQAYNSIGATRSW